MNKPALAICLFFASTVAFAQDAYKCKINGTMVIQDSPCKVVAPAKTAVARTEPTAVADPVKAQVSDAQARLERDKAWLDERAKKREQEEDQDRIKNCDAQAYAIQAQIEQTASTSGPAYKPNLIGVATMQLDEQRRQTDIAGLQSRVTAKRLECDQFRTAYSQRWKR